MSAFHRHRRSKLIIANFTGFEADLLRSLAGHNALICVPPGVPGLAAGDAVEAILIESP